MTNSLTARYRAKVDRQMALVGEATRLFAERGFSDVSIEDLGSAVGVSGPAVYRHFPSKQALLGAILVRASERTLAGGQAVIESDKDAPAQLTALVRFHVGLALTDAQIIRVQDRDLHNLSPEDRHRVRRLQREYLDLWIGVLAALHPHRSKVDLRIRAHACFGLIHSTAHSMRGKGGVPGVRTIRGILESMADAALTA